MDVLKPEAFFDLESFEHRDIFSGCTYVWQALGMISHHLDRHLIGNVSGLGRFREPLVRTLVLWNGEILDEGFEFLDGDVTKGTFRLNIGGEVTSDAVVLFAGAILWDDRIHLGPGTVVEPGALIKGPTCIGSHTEVRQGAYIRGKCIVGSRCVVGHTTEMKSSVMLDGAKAGHFAYIGDSILGGESNLGAGTKLANLKIVEGNVRIRMDSLNIDTGLRKFGAILGDGVEIGCNAVTNPGTLLGKKAMVCPAMSVPGGYHGPNSLLRPCR